MFSWAKYGRVLTSDLFFISIKIKKLIYNLLYIIRYRARRDNGCFV